MFHEVAQVVGAAFALSPQHGELATLTKLPRVALLAPVVMALRWRFMARSWTPAQLSRMCLLTAIAALGVTAGALL